MGRTRTTIGPKLVMYEEPPSAKSEGGLETPSLDLANIGS